MTQKINVGGWPTRPQLLLACSTCTKFLRALCDALIYILLSLGIYGVATLAVALIVLPAAVRTDVKELAIELARERMYGSAVHTLVQSAGSHLFAAFAPLWLSPFTPSPQGPMPIAAPVEMPSFVSDGSQALSQSVPYVFVLLLATARQLRR